MKTSSFTLLLSIFLMVGITCTCLAQYTTVGVGISINPDIFKRKWRSGAITFTDGKIVESDVFYDSDKEEVHSRTEDSEKIFSPSEVYSFKVHKRRDSTETYYALPFNFEDDQSRLVFFQLLKQLPTFAVFSKKAPKESYMSSGAGFSVTSGVPGMPGMSGMPVAPPVKVHYYPEMVYFLTEEGKMALFNTLNVARDPNRTFKNKLLDATVANMNLLKKVTDSHFDELVKYCKKKQLSYNKKEDIVKIFDYYQSLLE